MSNIAIFKPGETPQYLRSVNTPDYEGDKDILINPDISFVKDVPLKYWKRVGDDIQEMISGEKKVVDDKEKAEKDAQIDKLEISDASSLAKALVEAGVVQKDDLVTKLKEVISG